MKDITIAKALYIAMALVVAGMVVYWAAGYLGDTEKGVNQERVRMQKY